MTAISDTDGYFRAMSTGPWAEIADPGHRVGSALRRLAARALAGAPSDADLAALAEQLEAITPADDVPSKEIVGLPAAIASIAMSPKASPVDGISRASHAEYARAKRCGSSTHPSSTRP